MRNPERIDKVLAAIGEVWHKHPDLRLGQLIMNVYGDPYYVEDNELISGLIAYYNKGESNE